MTNSTTIASQLESKQNSIDRRFHVEDDVNLQQLIGRIAAALWEIQPSVVLSFVNMNGSYSIIKYETPEKSFRATVSSYKPAFPKISNVIGIEVYCSNAEDTDRASKAIESIVIPK